MDCICLLKVTVVSLVSLALLLEFSMFIIKFESDGVLSYYTIILPGAISLLVISLWALFYSIFFLFFIKILYMGFALLGLGILALGSLWSSIQIARKLESDTDISILDALLPFVISLFIAAVLLIVAIILDAERYSQKLMPSKHEVYKQ